MTTNINVVVGGDGLLPQAKAQTDANRFQQQEKERRIKAKAQGIEQRNAKRAEEGIGPDGKPLRDNHFKHVYKWSELSAQRFGNINVGHCWVFLDATQKQDVDVVLRRVYNTGSQKTYKGSWSANEEYPYLIGCGDGSQWQTFKAGLNNQPANGFAPLQPENALYTSHYTRTVLDAPYDNQWSMLHPREGDGVPESIGSFSYPNGSGQLYFGGYLPSAGIGNPALAIWYDRASVGADIKYFRRTSQTVSTDGDTQYFILPAGKDNFITVFISSYYWSGVTIDALWGRLSYSNNLIDDVVDVVPYGSTELYLAPLIYGAFRYASLLPPSLQNEFNNYTVTPQTGYQYRLQAYVGNNKSMREIAVPSVLQNVVRQYGASEPARTGSIYGTFNGQNYSFDNMYTGYISAPYSNRTGLGTDIPNGWTPDIFEIINQQAPFTSTANIKQFPSSTKKWRVMDETKGGYRIFDYNGPGYWPSNYGKISKLYSNGDSLYYADWAQANQQGYPWTSTSSQHAPTPKFIPKPGLTFNANRSPRIGPNTATSIYTGSVSYYDREALNIIWDWNDPAYCRFMCKELGFTDADLSP